MNCSAPLFFEREVVINCNSLGFSFLNHLLNLKILVEFAAFKSRGREGRGNATVQISFDCLIHFVLNVFDSSWFFFIKTFLLMT